MNDNWEGEERRRDMITIETLELCIFKALEKYAEKQKEEGAEAFRLRQAECPAFQSHRTIKWLISLPVISTAVLLVQKYLSEK